MKILFKTALIMSLLQLIYSPAAAQINLVPNPSFEEYDSCPNYFNNFFVKDWVSPTTGTPDYYNACSVIEVGVPQNLIGNQHARTGSGYIGIFLSYDESPTTYREYVQCKLNTPLLRNKKYKINFFVSLADSSKRACDNIGAYISKLPISSNDNTNFNYIPQIISKNNVPIINSKNWSEISGDFIANGEEQFLTIGIFSNDINTNFDELTSGWSDEPCYYIDDISVIEDENSPFVMPSAFSPNGDRINDTYFPIYFNSKIIIKEFRIYNQWGEILYNNPNIPWDGTYKNEPQPQSVYAYYVYIDLPVPDNLNETITYQKVGSFSLIR